MDVAGHSAEGLIGWILGWRTVLEAVLKSATPELRTRGTLFERRIQIIAKRPGADRILAGPNLQSAVLLFDTVSRPAHDIEERVLRLEELFAIRLRAEIALLDILRVTSLEAFK